MDADAPHILLVNPWIHDFAAYDFWARPLGLLALGALLREGGCRVGYVDCLDRFHPLGPPGDPFARGGRGPYRKTPIPRPEGLSDVPRRFSRYGIRPEWLRRDLAGAARPDLVLVTSQMTYWYPGVRETVAEIRRAFPEAPVALGGVYASLCTDHARRVSGADLVWAGAGEGGLADLVAETTGFRPSLERFLADPDARPDPALDLQRRMGFAPLLVGRGCPFRCAYCASPFLAPEQEHRSPGRVLEEIRRWHADFGVRDYAFYDDALLVDADRCALPLFEAVVRAGLPLRFHTPNALHIRGITAEAARLMARAGFETVRLGLETADFEGRDSLDRKVEAAEFARAAARLKAAGFHGRQVGAYLLAGLPGQDPAAVAGSIRAVHAAGVTPILAHYSPIPHTPLWGRAVAESRYDLESDPIFTNNAVSPCRPAFSWKELTAWKELARTGG